jgi:ABC-type transport system involved in cytochrome bd biosynthesis fused ATPase/permease subunit
MSALDDEIAATERAYRKAMIKLIVTLGFILLCCIVATGLRGMFGLPPALLSAVLIVALLLFSPEIFRFLTLRNKLQHLRQERDS